MAITLNDLAKAYLEDGDYQKRRSACHLADKLAFTKLDGELKLLSRSWVIKHICDFRCKFQTYCV